MVRNQKGFSLVELIVTMALLAIVSLAIGGFITTGSRSFVNSNREIEVQKEAQLSMNQMVDLIIDVEKGVQFQESTASLTGSEGTASVTKRELRLYNQKNNKSYLLRWYGSSDSITSEKENCIYLVEGTNAGEDDVVDFQFTGEEYLLARYVADFEADISELSERKVGLRMVYTVDNRTYETRETVKIRNDIATSTTLAEIYDGESVKIVWIESVNISGDNKITIGQTKQYGATLVGETDAVNLGVVWSVKRVDGTALSEGTVISPNGLTGNLTVSGTEALGTLEVKCASVSDSSKYAVMYVEVVDVEPTIAPTPTPTPTPTPIPTSTPTATPKPQLKAPEAEIYVKSMTRRDNPNSKSKKYTAEICLIPHANDNEAYVSSVTWNISNADLNKQTDLNASIYFKNGATVSATVRWSNETISETDSVTLQYPISESSDKTKLVYLNRGEVVSINRSGGGGNQKTEWELRDLNYVFQLNDAELGSTTIKEATSVNVSASANASVLNSYKAELIEKSSSGSVRTHTLIIPKAQLVLSSYYETTAKNSGTSQIDIDIYGVEDSLEAYKVEILNGTSKNTVIEFDNEEVNKFNVFIGKDETAAVIYVKVTATCQGTDFTALVAVEVQ